MTSAALKFPEYRVLITLLRHLLRYKYRVLFLAIILSLGVFALSYLFTPQYSATAVVAVNIAESRGGVSPGDYRSGDTLGVLEYEFLIRASQENERERILTRMESYNFLSGFIKENNLLPLIFAEEYIAENDSWKDAEPDMRDAVSIFKTEFLSVVTDKKTDLLQISLITTNPELSAHLSNLIVDAFNSHLRKIELVQMQKQRDYLESRLSNVFNSESQRSIFRLLETQLSHESLLSARDNYPLEMLQPATVPLHKASPSRKKWAVMTFILTIILGYTGTLSYAAVTVVMSDLKVFESSEEIQISQSEQFNELDDWVSEDEETM